MAYKRTVFPETRFYFFLFLSLWRLCDNVWIVAKGGGAGRPADAPGLQTSSPKMLQKLWPQPQPQNLRSGGVQFNDVQDMWCIIESLSRVSRMLYRHYWYMYNIAFSHQSKTKQIRPAPTFVPSLPCRWAVNSWKSWRYYLLKSCAFLVGLVSSMTGWMRDWTGFSWAYISICWSLVWTLDSGRDSPRILYNYLYIINL